MLSLFHHLHLQKYRYFKYFDIIVSYNENVSLLANKRERKMCVHLFGGLNVFV